MGPFFLQELTTSTRPSSKKSQHNGKLKPIPKPTDSNPFGGYHDDSDDVSILFL